METPPPNSNGEGSPESPDEQPLPSEAASPDPSQPGEAEPPTASHGAPPVGSFQTGGYEREGARPFGPEEMGASTGKPFAGGYPQPSSNYPRYQPTGSGPIPPPPAVIRFESIGQAWEIYKQDFGLFVAGMLVLLAFYVGEVVLISIIQLNYIPPARTLQEILDPIRFMKQQALGVPFQV